MTMTLRSSLVPLPGELKIRLAAAGLFPRVLRVDPDLVQGHRLSELKRSNANLFPSTKRLLSPGAVVEEIVSIRQRIEAIEEEHNEKLYFELARVLDLADFLAKSEHAWIEYCRHDKWDDVNTRLRPKIDKPEDSLRIVVTDLCSSIENSQRRKNRTNLYFSALRELAARGVTPPKAVDAIRQTEKGLSGLRAAYARRLEAARATAGVVEVKTKGKSKPKSEPSPRASGTARRKPNEQDDVVGEETSQRKRYVRVNVRNNKFLRRILKTRVDESALVKIRIIRNSSTVRLVFQEFKR